MAEFLPICDVLFNVISLAGYFCDVVFDVVMGYALLDRGYIRCFSAVVILVGGSLILSQVISLRWYLKTIISDKLPNNMQEQKKHHNIILTTVIAIHCFQLGVLWRYAKLFIPVDLGRVKHEVRDLCLLRIQHGFCQAAPMLLLQLYLMSEHLINYSDSDVLEKGDTAFFDMNTVAASLSLFSVCWALASFSKNVRLQNVHRLVLTWLGVIFQFLWRLGTVCSRVSALTVYATLYAHWVFLVIGLHWISMFLWLISPRNVFHGEKLSRIKKCTIAALISFVYVFAYVNLQEVNHKRKMITFYVVMFLENILLVSLWLVGIWSVRPTQWYIIPIFIIGCFALGVAFMILYYRYFHVRRLGYEAGGRPPSVVENLCANPSVCNNVCKCKIINKPCKTQCEQERICESLSVQIPNVPGVFNCRFSNPVGNGTKRKKKKPTTFIPHPPGMETVSPVSGPESVPFWRKPLPPLHVHQGGSSENENSSVGSRVNIYQKLQEKKQKQLAELKIIEEEIRQGKLGGPVTKTNDSFSTLPRQPIPVSKKHNDIEPIAWTSASPQLEKSYEDINKIAHNNCLNYQDHDLTNYNMLSTDILYNSNIYAHNLNEFQRPCQSNGNASPISQISATESNSLTQKTLSHIHMAQEFCYQENIQPYNKKQSSSHCCHSDNLNYNDNLFIKDSANNLQNDKKTLTQLSIQTQSPKTPDFTKVCDGRSNNSRNISYGDMHLSSIQNSFHYVIPPPKTKLDQNKVQRARTPEILLSPHYLNNSGAYMSSREPNYSILSVLNENGHSTQQEYGSPPHMKNENDFNIEAGHSDIDSQVSIPRSYTLPREFKYYKRNRCRKIKNEPIVVSTNSSDGDVDSADDGEYLNSSRVSDQNNSTSIRASDQQIPILDHLHDNIENNHGRYNSCLKAGDQENLNYMQPIKPGSIGRKARDPYSTANFSNKNEYTANNSTNSEMMITPKISRIRHYCNGPRPETKL